MENNTTLAKEVSKEEAQIAVLKIYGHRGSDIINELTKENAKMKCIPILKYYSELPLEKIEELKPHMLNLVSYLTKFQ